MYVLPSTSTNHVCSTQNEKQTVGPPNQNRTTRPGTFQDVHTFRMYIRGSSILPIPPDAKTPQKIRSMRVWSARADSETEQLPNILISSTRVAHGTSPCNSRKALRVQRLARAKDSGHRHQHNISIRVRFKPIMGDPPTSHQLVSLLAHNPKITKPTQNTSPKPAHRKKQLIDLRNEQNKKFLVSSSPPGRRTPRELTQCGNNGESRKTKQNKTMKMYASVKEKRI